MNLINDSILSFTPAPEGTYVTVTMPGDEKWRYPVLGYAVVVDDWVDYPNEQHTHLEPVVFDAEACGLAHVGLLTNGKWSIGEPPTRL